MRARNVALAALLVVAAIAVAALSGQTQRQPAALDDVVGEIRALRADLRQAMGATTRMQLLTARLSLEEQRIAVLANQRVNVAMKLGDATRQRADAEAQLERYEAMGRTTLPAQVTREELEGMINNAKGPLLQLRDSERQLRAEETQLADEIANEQNRWRDFNNRLDDLERSMATGR
jgi:chromosome segregation ATPase